MTELTAHQKTGNQSAQTLWAPLPTMLKLLQDLPGVVDTACERADLDVPKASSPLGQTSVYGRYDAECPTRPTTVWPLSPVVACFLKTSIEDPGKLKAPVSTFAPLTLVEGLSADGFFPVPSLEPSLAALFGVKCN